MSAYWALTLQVASSLNRLQILSLQTKKVIAALIECVPGAWGVKGVSRYIAVNPVLGSLLPSLRSVFFNFFLSILISEEAVSFPLNGGEPAPVFNTQPVVGVIDRVQVAFA